MKHVMMASFVLLILGLTMASAIAGTYEDAEKLVWEDVQTGENSVEYYINGFHYLTQTYDSVKKTVTTRAEYKLDDIDRSSPIYEPLSELNELVPELDFVGFVTLACGLWTVGCSAGCIAGHNACCAGNSPCPNYCHEALMQCILGCGCITLW